MFRFTSPPQTRADFAFEGFFRYGQGLWKAEYREMALLDSEDGSQDEEQQAGLGRLHKERPSVPV